MTVLSWFAAGISLISCAYVVLAITCVRRFARIIGWSEPVDGMQPGITILKPLCGLDPGLLGNLRSFCGQRYADFQIIFGVMDGQDPAIDVVRKVMEEYPGLDLELVIDDRVHGANRKISNLINMVPRARHDLFVIADSDMRVPVDYLARISQVLRDSRIGMVTSLYLGQPHDSLASRLGAMYINDWFLPSVLVADRLAGNRFCFGATMALPRSVLEEIGGLESLVDYLADDYVLGKAVTDSGRRVGLAPMLVENVLQEPTFGHLFQHELRWARTIRTVQPLGYALSFLTDTLPLSILAALLLTFAAAAPAAVGLALVLFALLLRTLLHWTVVSSWNRQRTPWLCPIRDLLTFLIRAASYLGGNVEWRQQSLHVDTGSQLSVKR